MINIDYRSGQPLYYQIVEGFKRLILNGVISENEKLPSVRELASLLTINPNTIQRAYRELEAEGYVGSSPGKGVFAMGREELKEKDIEAVYINIDKEIKKLIDYNIEPEEILKQISTRLNDKEVM